MQKIVFDSTLVSGQREAMMKVQQGLAQVAQNLNDINRGLNWKITAGTQIKQSITGYNSNLLQLSQSSGTLGNALTEISRRYEQTEKRLAGVTAQKANTTPQTASGSAPSRQNGRTENQDTTEKQLPDRFDSYRDLVDFIGNIIGAFKDSDGAQFFSGMIGLSTAILGGATMGASSQEVYEAMAGLFSSGTGAIGNVFKLIGDKKYENYDSAFGLISSVVGLTGSVSKLFSQSIEESLRDAGDIISGMKGVGTSIYSFNGGELTEAGKEKLAAAVALATIGTRFCGDVVMYTKDDGRFDIMDYATTLIDSGAAGGASLIKGASLGIINLDPDRAVSIYKKNANAAAKIISDTGAPTAVQVAMVVPGTVISSAWSTMEVFVDFGMELGNKINSLFRW